MKKEMIDTEINNAWEELKQRGISQKEYTLGVTNIQKLVDIREKTSKLDFEEECRLNKEDREWFKATTDRLLAEAKLGESSSRIEAAKIDAQARTDAAKIDADARLEAARLDWEARMRESDAKVKVAEYDCAGRVIDGLIKIGATYVLASWVMAMDQDGVFPQKFITMITGIKK